VAGAGPDGVDRQNNSRGGVGVKLSGGPLVIQQNRYILAAQQLLRLNSALGKQSGPVETIRGELDEIASRAGVDLAVASRLTPESLELLVAPSESSDPLRCWLLAEMLFISGRLAEREGDMVAAQESDVRAVHLFERVDVARLPDVELPLPAARIAEISSNDYSS